MVFLPVGSFLQGGGWAVDGGTALQVVAPGGAPRNLTVPKREIPLGEFRCSSISYRLPLGWAACWKHPCCHPVLLVLSMLIHVFLAPPAAPHLLAQPCCPGTMLFVLVPENWLCFSRSLPGSCWVRQGGRVCI